MELLDRIVILFLNFLVSFLSWLCWVFVAAQAFLYLWQVGGYSAVVLHGLLTAVASPVAVHGL